MVNLQLSFQLANVNSVLYPLISTRGVSKPRVVETRLPTFNIFLRLWLGVEVWEQG